jgi:histone arginine demethylase JMJD6
MCLVTRMSQDRVAVQMTFQVETRSNLSYGEFVERYLNPNMPVIVTDALRQWRALSRWTPEFFQDEFGETAFTIHGDTGSVRYTIAPFIDSVLGSTEQHPAPYLRNQILSELFPALLPDIQPLPEYFFPNWLPDRYLAKPVRDVLNRGAAIELYIGGKGAVFPVLHYDGLGTHAFLMQIYGRKQFVVYAPEQESFLYPSPAAPNRSLVDVDKPDGDRFPLFAQATPTTFVLEPGQLLFVPSRWWHTTKMLTPCISVSINTANGSNWPNLVSDIAAGRRNPFVSLAARVYLTGAGAWRLQRDRLSSHQLDRRTAGVLESS